MAIQTNQVTNANLYIDGANHLGKVQELDLPDVKIKMVEHKILGMIGTIELPAGIEKLEAKIKWNSFYDDAFDKISNPYAARQIQVRQSLESWNSSGRVGQAPLVVFLNGTFKNVPLGKFKQHDNVEMESLFNVTAARLMSNGVTKFEYDAMANIYRVGGVDVFDLYHANTGA